MCVPRRRTRAAEGHREAARTLFGGCGDRVIDQVALSSSALNLNWFLKLNLQKVGLRAKQLLPEK